MRDLPSGIYRLRMRRLDLAHAQSSRIMHTFVFKRLNTLSRFTVILQWRLFVTSRLLNSNRVPSIKGSILKGKSLFPMRANSFLLYKYDFQNGAEQF